jgi:sugar lactone lactonase YvrE
VAAFDVDSGLLDPAESFVDLMPVDGVPDGMAIDCDGGVWIAMFGGGQLRRYRADGGLDRIVRLPVTHPTSVAFGGEGLRTLYVTTSRHRLTPAQAAEQPDAGAVFAIEVDVAGTPVAGFSGPT